MRKQSNVGLWLLLPLLTCAFISSSAGATPDWVRQAAAAKLPAYEPETNAVVLLDQVSIAVSSPGDYREL